MKYNFTIADFLLGINDSMELDSGQIVATLETSDLLVEIRVEGYVRVVFNDEVYKASSQMPQELIDLFHNGGEEYEKALEDGRLYIDDNNWFESFIYYKNPNYKSKDKESAKWLFDDAWCDVLDGGWKSETDVINTLLELAKEYKKATEVDIAVI